MFKAVSGQGAVRTISCAALTMMLLASCGGGSGSAATGTTDAALAAETSATTGTTAPATSGSSDAAAPSAPSASTGDSGDSAPAPSAPSAPAGSTTPSAPAAPATPSAPAATPAPTAPAAPAALAPAGQDASKYELTFSDEFNGSSLNNGVWNDAIWYESSNATKNYAVEDGKLKIWPERDGSGNFFNRTIDTDGKFYQTYGYFEMEAKLPYGKGTWPAFWLFNHDGAHPLRPEIDILEAYAGGGPNSGWSDSSFRPTAFAATVWPTGIQNGGYAGTKTFQNLGDLSGGFHKYAVKWEPNKITFYFDGKEMYSVNSSMGSRMYIILDLWYGSASGNPDGSTPTGKGNSYEINYVRAWKLK